MASIAERRKEIAIRITLPFVRLLARSSITPNAISWIGFVITVIAAVVIFLGFRFAGGWVVLLAGFFDMLDGALARHTKQTSTFGAALDSTLDRLSEGVLLLAVLFLFAQSGSPALVALTGAALIGSYMVSYIRARAEGIGLELTEGLFTRTERVIVLALGLLFSQFNWVLAAAVGTITVLSYITAGQRLSLVWRKTSGK